MHKLKNSNWEESWIVLKLFILDAELFNHEFTDQNFILTGDAKNSTRQISKLGSKWWPPQVGGREGENGISLKSGKCHLPLRIQKTHMSVL